MRVLFKDLDSYSLIDSILACGVEPRSDGNPGGSGKKQYLHCFSAFDIETSTVYKNGDPHSFMYVWQWHFYPVGVTVIGRTWSEFQSLAEEIAYRLKGKMWLVVLVHNLSYEIQFLEGIYPFKPDEIFCLKSRSVLKATMHDRLEFRCTFRHANMGLEKYLKKFHVEHLKKSGEEFGYKKIRYPWTDLTDLEYEYAENDVIGLCEAYAADMNLNHDNLYTIPPTATGYVRRELKRAMHCKYQYLKYQQPSVELYQLLRKAFRGGDTHANRYYSGVVLHDVHSFDRSSSYPDVIVNCKFPVTKFQPVRYLEHFDILKESASGRASVFVAQFKNIRLRSEYNPNPYLSYDKCEILSTKTVIRRKREIEAEDVELDNGRVLRSGELKTAMTDIDFKIVSQVYEWDSMTVIELFTARYDFLPSEYTDLVKEYYRRKTELKGNKDMEFFYNKSKELLNSLYGCMCQDALKDDVFFDDSEKEGINGGYHTRKCEPDGALEKFYRQPYTMYQWGVWVTAWARFRLFEMQKLCGRKIVYWDTDSVKFVGSVSFDGYNKMRIRDSLRSGAYADDSNGTRHFMGVAEHDAEYTEFKTLGAKKYVYREKDDEQLHVTISGVNKKKGGPELDKHGGIEAFKDGFVFRDAGGVELVYNDDDNFLLETNEGRLWVSRNVSIVDSEYTVSTTAEYADLLYQLAGISFDLEDNDFDLSEFLLDE